MNRKALAVLCLLLAVFQAFPAMGESGGATFATVGGFTVTDGMVRLYGIQDEAARVVAARFGMVPPDLAGLRMDGQAAGLHVLTVGAAAWAAQGAGIHVGDEAARKRVVEELFQYPEDQGLEYFGEYARYVTGRFGGSEESLLLAAVPLKKMEMLADEYLRSALEGILKNRTDEDAARVLADSLAAVPVTRQDGAAFEPAYDWLFQRVFVLRGFR